MSDWKLKKAESELTESTLAFETAMEHLRERLESEVERVGHVVDQVRHPGAKLKTTVGEFLGEGQKKASDFWSRARETSNLQLRELSDRPVFATSIFLLGGAALGLVAGTLLKLGRRSRAREEQLQAEFVDKCTSRWVFEKTAAMLYDEAIQKAPLKLRDRLIRIRNEEKRHEEMLEDVIRSYGANPHDLTEAARITLLESEGIVRVVRNEDFQATLDALLAAELVDNANWALLGKLAKEVGDTDARIRFDAALAEEEKQLVFLRQIIKDNALSKAGLSRYKT